MAERETEFSREGVDVAIDATAEGSEHWCIAAHPTAHRQRHTPTPPVTGPVTTAITGTPNGRARHREQQTNVEPPAINESSRPRAAGRVK